MTEQQEHILSALNPSQREAVEYCDGPALVIAGAGSGKTRVLTYKIAYLLSLGYEPWSILALTFTNKAADEMKARIGQLIDNDEVSRRLWMGTFHSVFLRILRYEWERTGFASNFTVYDASDSKSLIKAIIKEMSLDDKVYKAGNVQAQISNAKNQLLTADDYVASPALYQADTRAHMPAIGQIYKRYSDRCRQANAMDFDDLLLFTYLLFKNNDDVLQKYAQRFHYILVDEYQDTNYAQHQIVQQLGSVHQHVCVVGDDAQSIYSFRGANIDNILSFNRIYTDSRLFKLEQNYRSTQTIVKAANSLIHKNQGQIPKNVFSEKESGERLSVTEAYSDIEEGQIVTRRIGDLHRRENIPFSGFAILYRTHAQSRIFEEALRKSGYPYRIYGGMSFYQRKEVKDVIAYFRLTVNPDDEEAFKRILNYPARGIGQTTLSKIVDCATVQNVSLWSVVCEPLKYQLNVSNATLTKIQNFRLMMERFRQMAAVNSAEIVGQNIMKESGVVQDIYSDITPEGKARQENLEELMNGLQEFVETRQEEGTQSVTLTDYLSEISLLTDLDSADGADEERITLMTIHSAKGLEFNTVFVVGLEENLFPSQLANSSLRELEEERRLFYVAVTRAERHCFLTYAKSRLRYGKMEFGNPSRFITDIDPQFLDFHTSVRSAQKKSRYDDVELPWKPRQRFGAEPQRKEAVVVQMPQPTVPPRFKPATYADIRNNHNPNQPTVTVGMRILHTRFGEGEVLKVEGTGDNAKATVAFINAGTKQLLLKFARFTIIN